MKKFLITGVKGQIGQFLLPKLIKQYGADNIIATDISNNFDSNSNISVNYLKLNVNDSECFESIIKNKKITNIIHLASILSALAEKNPELAKKVNIDSVLTVLDLSRKYNLSVFIPSTIGVYGSENKKVNVNLNTKPVPTTIYGVSKIFLENLGYYYKKVYGVDFRSIRYIGVISPKEYMYNGSTDYASEMFQKIKKNEKHFICLTKDRRLPMAYIDDIIDGTLLLLNTDKKMLSECIYNINSVDFSPEEIISNTLNKNIEYKYEYKPDIRDTYASTWPYNYDDSKARSDFGWNPVYNSIDKIVEKMIEEVNLTYNNPLLDK